LRNFEGIVLYDQLTQLHNRNAYIDVVNQIVKPENMPLVIFIGDVNRLKQINDSYGHQVGDELLVMVSNFIREVQPPGSFVARVGGDEFVLLIPGGSQELADQFVQDMIMRCSSVSHDVFGSPSISWGYSIMTSTDQSYNEVFSEADKIMYSYKRSRHAFRSSGLVPDT
ncbi:MAG: GGDEF domain-containing protein, partial [Oscillospiraceae bacterium]|nr:GGDEF domain-containing protein [Oscillospiraceae bacterium]